jgi:hypothetical protein
MPDGERVMVPAPTSAGLMLSYKCPAACAHCMYACSPQWSADWIAEPALAEILDQLARTIEASPLGPERVGVSDGLHFSGGEPFMSFELLARAVDLAASRSIPSLFVETNAIWCKNDDVTRDRLVDLRDRGMHGLMVSVNPFFLEYVPFERTERAVRIGYEVFGVNLMVYQVEYFRRFLGWGLKDVVPFSEYLERERPRNVLRNAEFFAMGRAVYALAGLLEELVPRRPAAAFVAEPCRPDFLRSWHNHVDNYGNYMPGFCAGITLGDARKLDEMISTGVSIDDKPVLGFLVRGDMSGLLQFAEAHGYQEPPAGYFSKCHLCVDIRGHLVGCGDFCELAPGEYYEQLASAAGA